MIALMNTLKYVKNYPTLAQILVRTNWLTVVNRLIKLDKQPFTLWQAIFAIRQSLRFLMLVVQYPEACLVPNKEIDAVIHILEQNSLFNRYFDHQPGLGTRGEADRRAWLQAFSSTRELFERHFGAGSMGNVQPGACQVVDYRFDRVRPACCEVCLKLAEIAI
jgi:hypothetical protein